MNTQIIQTFGFLSVDWLSFSFDDDRLAAVDNHAFITLALAEAFFGTSFLYYFNTYNANPIA
jgi:hypothetical protein